MTNFDDGVYQSPKLVAGRLGVSASGLRRLAAIYEGVFGELPKDAMGGRLWEAQAVARLEAAKTLVDAGRVKSVKDALKRPKDLIEAELETLPQKVDASEALSLVLAELRDLRAQVSALQQRQLEAPIGETKRDAELREQRRMNEYLMGELERRSKLETKALRHRPWWRWS